MSIEGNIEYRFGITKVLEGMNKRTKNRSKMNLATKELKLFYNEFENDFMEFFTELIAFSNTKLLKIENHYT